MNLTLSRTNFQSITNLCTNNQSVIPGAFPIGLLNKIAELLPTETNWHQLEQVATVNKKYRRGLYTLEEAMCLTLLQLVDKSEQHNFYTLTEDYILSDVMIFKD